MQIEPYGLRGRAFAILTVTASLALSGCLSGDSDNDDAPAPTPPTQNTYSAEIQRTQFGIPHITAQDYKGLGYGVGYAFAEDNICSFAEEIVFANGESARYLPNGSVASDIFYTWYNSDTQRQTFWDAQNQQVRDAVSGYAAGYNRYLRDTGVGSIDPACAGQPWVREITEQDLLAVYGKGGLRGGLSNFVGPIVAAQPPGAPASANSDTGFDMTNINVTNGGSNAYALGSELTANGNGMLYGNPHEPWDGVQRFYEFHLTLPGELDVMGVGQQGQPFPNIGFNKDVAWSHTVSTAKRFTLYQLALVDGNPMKYLYQNADGQLEQRDIERVDVSVQLADGNTHQGSVYLSHFGPMLAVNLVNEALPPWGGNNIAFAIRDAASENPRAINQWLAMDKATSVDDLVDKLQSIVGLPFVNTIATDRYGKAMYADISTVPHVTAEKFQACVQGPALEALAAAGIPGLAGHTAACEWGEDADSPQKGIFGPGNLPVLVRNDYVANSNDSYWLSNPDEPLTGYSPLLRRRLLSYPGASTPEAVPLLVRSRMGLVQIEDRLDGTDGLGGMGFTLDQLQQVVYGNRSYVAELVLDDVLDDCFANPAMPTSEGGTVDATTACQVLNDWDRRNNLDSRGAHVFREFWKGVPFQETTANVFSVPFDENDPINTPRELTITAETRTALGDAIAFFQSKNIALDAALGEIQFVVDPGNNGERIPMHGGIGREGVFNVAEGPGPDENGLYTPINKGPTYMQTVTFDEDGPVVEALLAYSQSSDETSPNHRDQTRRYSAKDWIPLPFSPAEIAEQAVGRKLVLSE
ncbi:acyl-homoserine-lactone acylase [Halopseudomonas xinjiangensis]|uniref:Acyl-homoserine-lactone acylase n=1 Tax=Halopseudomonas xinjiangensis TaxID=487184 RepID=A0A1H1T9P6_9GAMM|nr:penicillin acylase family protein [Halopseudomonas xinjiangensis]SDS56970.1 acyl-homoserine-lactone acylase [Halopseudomonas xinjiangensis]